MSSEGISKATRYKIHFLWFRHRSIYRLLSLNVSREVCGFLSDYLGPDTTIVPIIYNNVLRLYDVKTRTVTVKTISSPASIGMITCYTVRNSVLSFGGLQRPRSVYEFFPPLYQGREIKRMDAERLRPGVFCNNLAVYVLGGDRLSAGSCEKMTFATNSWTTIGRMSTSRCSFTPCFYQDELYLVDALAEDKSIEVFSLRTEAFRQMRATLPSSLACSSITLEMEGNLLVLFDNGFLTKLNINREEVTWTKTVLRNGLYAISASPPVAFHGSFYFCNEQDGELARFDAYNRSLVRERFIDIKKKKN